ncbi:protein of unknown function [Burkholderia multivorans]
MPEAVPDAAPEMIRYRFTQPFMDVRRKLKHRRIAALAGASS